MAIPNELDQVLGDFLPHLRLCYGRLEEISGVYGVTFSPREFSKFRSFVNVVRSFANEADAYQESLWVDDIEIAGSPPEVNPDFPKQGTPEYAAILEEH